MDCLEVVPFFFFHPRGVLEGLTATLRERFSRDVRVRTPWFLLRGDYGIVLDPRPGERRGRFYFSIGQAF